MGEVSDVNLYEKYGGFGAINRIVMAFYDQLLDSDEIGPFFDGLDMSRLIDHQTKFVASLLGGPASFSDQQLQRAHASLNIGDDHFDELKRIMFDTLIAHGVSDDDASTVLTAIEARRGVIVTLETV